MLRQIERRSDRGDFLSRRGTKARIDAVMHDMDFLRGHAADFGNPAAGIVRDRDDPPYAAGESGDEPLQPGGEAGGEAFGPVAEGAVVNRYHLRRDPEWPGRAWRPK